MARIRWLSRSAGKAGRDVWLHRCMEEIRTAPTRHGWPAITRKAVLPMCSELAMSSCLQYLKVSSSRYHSGDDSSACAPCEQRPKQYLLVLCYQGSKCPRESGAELKLNLAQKLNKNPGISCLWCLGNTPQESANWKWGWWSGLHGGKASNWGPGIYPTGVKLEGSSYSKAIALKTQRMKAERSTYVPTQLNSVPGSP